MSATSAGRDLALATRAHATHLAHQLRHTLCASRCLALHLLPVRPAALERVPLAREHASRERRAGFAASQPFGDLLGARQRREGRLALAHQLACDGALVGGRESLLHRAPHLVRRRLPFRHLTDQAASTSSEVAASPAAASPPSAAATS